MAFFPSFSGKMISGLPLLSGRHFVLALLLPALISSLDDDGKTLFWIRYQYFGKVNEYFLTTWINSDLSCINGSLIIFFSASRKYWLRNVPLWQNRRATKRHRPNWLHSLSSLSSDQSWWKRGKLWHDMLYFRPKLHLKLCSCNSYNFLKWSVHLPKFDSESCNM